MKKVTYFDVEYANSKNKSICQLGLLCEDFATGEPYYPEKNLYVNPEDGFDNMCIRVHGITHDRVKSEPAFPVLWKEIEKYFTNSVIVGHNVAGADLDALVKNLRRYNIDIPELYYICTLDLARKYVPRYAVANYSMATLCEYFDIDIDSEHDAFDDACANSDLFKALVEAYSIDVDAQVRKYVARDTRAFIQFVSSPVIRKSISEFYGMICGFAIDNVITEEEAQYLQKWRDENACYSSQESMAAIVGAIDAILEDGIVTSDEMAILKNIVKQYLDTVSTSSVTLATQILDGIMKGIVVDGRVSEEECRRLREWLYANIYLAGHYPFDKVMKMIDTALEDEVITKEESDYISSTISELLNPVETLKERVNTITGKHICLSGNFAFGQKSAVEKYIGERQGVIDSSLKKSTDILLIGDRECQAYSNGTFGTKTKKAIEYNQKGAQIQIVKESDFFANIK